VKENILTNKLITLPASLKEILENISKNRLGIVFVVDRERRLLGSIADGDIRRVLTKDSNLQNNVTLDSPIINLNPFSLPVNSDIQLILNTLDTDFEDKIIRCIPLLDSEGRVVEISTRSIVRQYPIAQPAIGHQEIANVMDSVKSGWISYKGPYVSKFEKLFSDYFNERYSVAVSSGTAALQLGMSSLGIGAGDKVIVPNYTFAASINSIINCGAKPVLVDVEMETWTLDLKKIEDAISSSTKAIMLVHVYGQPCKMDEIIEIAKKNKLLIIEDCAEAIGAKYKNRLVGLDGDCSCFSFFANKTITTGEGGMVLFKDSKLGEKARILKNHGMSQSKSYWHEHAGFNFRMTNMQAAIGVAQLERIAELLKRRKKIFNYYDKKLKNIKRISLLPSNNWSENSYWLYTIVINDIGEEKRDKIVLKLKNSGIDCRPSFYPLNLMQPYKKFGQGNYEVSTYLSYNSLSLPSSSLSENEQDHIVETLLNELSALKLV